MIIAHRWVEYYLSHWISRCRMHSFITSMTLSTFDRGCIISGLSSSTTPFRMSGTLPFWHPTEPMLLHEETASGTEQVSQGEKESQECSSGKGFYSCA